MIIKNREELESCGDREGRRLALDIIEAGLTAADPYANVQKLIRREGDRLLIGGAPDKDVSGYGDEAIDLSQIDNIYVIGAGKAVQRQAQALENILGERLTAGAINVKHGEGCHLRRILVTEAAHPVPDENSMAGARRIVEIVKSAGKRDLIFTLFSDGASSLFVLPAPGLTLEDVRQIFFLGIRYGSQRLIHQAMLYASAVKYGRLATMLHPARSVNLIMQVGLFPRWHGKLPEAGSWVPSWPPGVQTMDEVVPELEQRPWWDKLPFRVRAVMERRDSAYDVPDRARWSQMRASYWQPIDLYQMVAGAKAKADALGLNGVILSSRLAALSSSAASVLSQIAYECHTFQRPFTPPVALITGGHLDVPVAGATGVGGRNQEFTLLWARELGQGLIASKRVVVAAVDSDGTDGPGVQHHAAPGMPPDVVCMAGGLADGYTLELAAERGVDVDNELANHNSSVALAQLNGAIYTGNTGMALGDLRVAVVR